MHYAYIFRESDFDFDWTILHRLDQKQPVLIFRLILLYNGDCLTSLCHFGHCETLISLLLKPPLKLYVTSSGSWINNCTQKIQNVYFFLVMKPCITCVDCILIHYAYAMSMPTLNSLLAYISNA